MKTETENRSLFSQIRKNMLTALPYMWTQMEICLFVLGSNVSLTLFQSYCDGASMIQVIVLPHLSAPVAGTGQEHPTQSHYKLPTGRPTMFPSTHILMSSVSKWASGNILLRLLVCGGTDRTRNLPYPKLTIYHWTTWAGDIAWMET